MVVVAQSARSSRRSWTCDLSKAFSTTWVQTLSYLGRFAIPDGLDEQVPERAAPELELSEHIEDLAAQRVAGLFQLLEEAPVDIALTRLFGHEVPEVADLSLANTMDTPEALLQPVGVPWQVIIDHEVGALEVDTFAGGIRR